MTEIIYKCETCGKWSHAQRKPKRHQRIVSEEPSDSSIIVEYLPAAYDHMNGYTGDDGWTIWCGPFITYYAVPEQPQFDFNYEQEEEHA